MIDVCFGNFCIECIVFLFVCMLCVLLCMCIYVCVRVYIVRALCVLLFLDVACMVCV